jgi:hypothetical protein
MHAFTFVQVDYFNAVVAESADKQSLAGCVAVEVVYPALDSRQRNCLPQLNVRWPGDNKSSGYRHAETNN